MVSVVSVASCVGVSPVTVSRVREGGVPVATKTRARDLKVIEQLGDMAVVGFGDLPWMGFSLPTMSSVALADTIARFIGDFSKAREGGARPGKHRLNPANLVLRQSA
jgi:DNA-binding LacI/PurR family transcriptional regulator